MLVALSSWRRGRGFAHCAERCRRLGRRRVSVPATLRRGFRPCRLCAHDADGRTGGALLARPWPAEPACRPLGRAEWLRAAVPGRPDLQDPVA